MIRLILLLCAGMFGALLIAGEDRGQLRPGLAKAAAEGRLNPVPEAEVAEAAPLATVELQPAPVVASVAETEAAEPEAAVVQATFAPAEIEPSAVAPTRRTPPKPVFTLSGLAQPDLPEAVAEPAPAEASVEGGSDIRYVIASTVNVREEATTDSQVVGKLARGEAARVVWEEGQDWARIVIEGDGIEGYVAARFLSPVAP